MSNDGKTGLSFIKLNNINYQTIIFLVMKIIICKFLRNNQRLNNLLLFT